ncbi:MAG: hypothetical protein KDB07_11320 [Planctomycetes bacterium]|nr:hypothetical protein [Planctomycetota bacterium]
MTLLLDHDSVVGEVYHASEVRQAKGRLGVVQTESDAITPPPAWANSSVG